MALIAAVIPTLGASPYLEASVAALLRDAGPDGEPISVFLAHPKETSLPRSLDTDGVTRCPTERPLGFAAATNLGIAAALDAGADWIATVNDDLEILPGWAGSLVRVLTGHPEVGAVQGVQLRLDDPSRVDGCGLAWSRGWQAVQLRHGEPPPPPDEAESEIFGVSATAAVYRAAALAGVTLDVPGRFPGPFDALLGSYYEDVDLACRLRGAGGKALLVPEARALHAGSATGRSMSLRRWRWIYGNRWLVLARLLGGRFLREVPRILQRDLRDLARSALSGKVRQSVGVLSGWGRALRHGRAFAHRGAPLVPLDVLEGFRVSSGHP